MFVHKSLKKLPIEFPKLLKNSPIELPKLDKPVVKLSQKFEKKLPTELTKSDILLGMELRADQILSNQLLSGL